MTVLAVQAAVAGPPATYDLAKVQQPKPCDRAQGDDIVVCGSDKGEHDRLKPVREQFDQPTIPKAETTLFGKVKATAEVESVELPGATSKRAMIRLTLPF